MQFHIGKRASNKGRVKKLSAFKELDGSLLSSEVPMYGLLSGISNTDPQFHKLFSELTLCKL